MKPQLHSFIPRLFPFLILTTFIFSSCTEKESEAKEIPRLSEADSTQIEQMAAQFARKFTSGELKGVEKLFTDSVNWFGTPLAAHLVIPEWNKIRAYFDNYNCVFPEYQIDFQSIDKDFVFLKLAYQCSDSKAIEPFTFDKEVDLKFQRAPEIRISSINFPWRKFRDALVAKSNRVDEQFELYTKTGTPNFDNLLKLYEKYMEKEYQIAYVTSVDDIELLYLGKDGYNGSWYQPKWKPKGKVALANKKGELLSGKWYDHIGTFGMITDGLAEVRLNEKWGLIDTNGDEILAPECDRLYPATSSKYLAIFERKGQFAGVNVDGKPELLNSPPDWKKMISHYDFKARLMPTKNGYEGPAAYPLSRYGHAYAEYVCPPSAFVSMGLASPSMVVRVYDPRAVKALSISKTLPEKSGFWGLIAQVEEWAFGPRESYHSKTYTASTYDSALNVISKVELMKAGGDDLDGTYCEVNELKMLGKDTIEVKFNFSGTFGIATKTEYKYFVLRENGKIEELKAPTKFPFLHFAKMDKNHLKRCWVAHNRTIESGNTGDPDTDRTTTEFLITKHFAASEVADLISLLEKQDSLSALETHNLTFLKGYLPEVRKNEKRLVSAQKKEITGW